MFVDQMEEYLKSMKPETIYLNKGVNSDSKLTTQVPDEKYYKEACPNAKVDQLFMHNILVESRVLKNEEEIEIMRWASKITCEAH
jgi:Xaa-Pro aminopeptidase